MILRKILNVIDFQILKYSTTSLQYYNVKHKTRRIEIQWGGFHRNDFSLCNNKGQVKRSDKIIHKIGLIVDIGSN